MEQIKQMLLELSAFMLVVALGYVFFAATGNNYLLAIGGIAILSALAVIAIFRSMNNEKKEGEQKLLADIVFVAAVIYVVSSICFAMLFTTVAGIVGFVVILILIILTYIGIIFRDTPKNPAFHEQLRKRFRMIGGL